MKGFTTMMTFADVRALALALPEATEGTSYSTPAFKVRGKVFARLREEGDILVVKVDSDLRDALIQMLPAIYFVTPHYAGAPYVLVRLSQVDPDELRDRLVESWKMSAPKRLCAAFAAEMSGQATPMDGTSHPNAG